MTEPTEHTHPEARAALRAVRLARAARAVRRIVARERVVAALGRMLARRRERGRTSMPRALAAEVGGPRLDTPALQAVRALLDPDRPAQERLLVLVGANDAGKTYALGWLCLQLGGTWVHAETLIDAWATGRAALMRAPCLVVDDIGRGGWSPDQRAAQAEILDALVKIGMAGGQVIALGGNLTRAGLEEFWTSAPRGHAPHLPRWDRFRERLRQHGVRLDGPLEGVVELAALGLRRRPR